MKKLFVVVFLCGGIAFLRAQTDTSDYVITLNNGNQFKGKIIELKRGEFIKVLKEDNSISSFDWGAFRDFQKVPAYGSAEVKRRKQLDEKTGNGMLADSVIRKEKFHFSLVVGTGVGYDFFASDRYLLVEQRIAVGGRYKYLRIGLDMRFTYALLQDGHSPYFPKLSFLPIGLNLHMTPGKKSFKPCIDIVMSYPVSVNKEIASNFSRKSVVGLGYVQLGPGICGQISRKLMLSVGITFTALFYQFQTEDLSGYKRNTGPNVSIPLGLRANIIY